MNWNQTEANWAAFIPMIKYDWDQLIDAQLAVVMSRCDYLISLIETMFGFNKAKLETQLNEWQNNHIHIDGRLYQAKPFSAPFLTVAVTR